MHTNATGTKQTRVRAGYSDYDTYGSGYCMAATGNLDAPKWIPQGSVRLFAATKPTPMPSITSRDYPQWMEPGDVHDGPESAAHDFRT